MLFDPDVELSHAPKGEQDSYRDSIGRFEGAGWNEVRQRLEDWVSRYPDGEADHFRGRLTKRATGSFWGATSS